MTKEETRDYHRRWSKDNREKNNAKRRVAAKRRYAADPEKHKEKCRRWKKSNPEKVRAGFRRWIKENILRVRKNENRYRAEKKMADPEFRIKCNLRTRISIALRLKGKKAYKTEELLGCSIGYFRARLEARFKPGMTWENYGHKTWHIDHVKPCAKFDLSSPQQQKECFHYTNLQPLWKDENLRKGDTYVV